MKKDSRFYLFMVLFASLVIGLPFSSFAQNSVAHQGPEPVITMETGNQVVEQVNVIDEMIGSIDWENNIIYAVGDGVMPQNAISPAQARVRAKRAAIDEGYGRLLEMASQVRVDAESLTRNFVNENRVVRTKVSGMIKNAEIVKLRHMEDGSFQIKMKMSMLGANGLSAAVFPVHLEKVRKVGIAFEISRERNSSSIPMGKASKTGSLSSQTPAKTGNTFTGLILDAQGLKGKPSLYPKIVSESGKIIYAVNIADPNATVEEGLTSFRKSLDAAKSLKRSGSNPLIIKPMRTGGKYRADFIVSDADADKILSANAKRDFLSEAKVVVVLD